MLNRIIQAFAFTVIGLFLLAMFGWLSVHLSKGDKDFGFLNEPVKFMYSFPDMFEESVEEAKTFALPKTFVKTRTTFQPINKLEEDVFALTSYSDTNNSRTIAVINLKDHSIQEKWTFHKEMMDHLRVFHPMLLPNKDLIFSLDQHTLTRVDSNSNVQWVQSGAWPHHAKNLDNEGNIWLSTYPNVYYGTGMYKHVGREVSFKDEFINKIDGKTGEILFNKSMAELLYENGLSNYLLTSGNIFDPIHVNDVQPALKTTAFYQEGDVFISAKHLSAILHYRPSTNELIDYIRGPFNSQHDVDFFGDSSIIFFNNNDYSASMYNYEGPSKDPSKVVFAGDLYSEIMQYNLATKEFSYLLKDVFREHEIFTATEGLQQFYAPNAVFVEEQNDGILWIIKEGEVVYKNVLKSQHEGFHHLPNWTTILTDYE